jgi:hypothetical protein
LENRGTVELSVVLASRVAEPEFAHCLAALKPQIDRVGGEIMIVDASGMGPAAGSYLDSAELRMIRLPPGTEVPKLWTAGVARSKGRIVALLVDSCIPEPDWAERILDAHRAQPAVIGGAIDLAATAGYVDSAVYFCRYSRYMPPFEPHFPRDLPGNNCSYKRPSLDGLEQEMADGFWETFIHHKMLSRGEKLLCDPRILVHCVGSASGMSFLRARFVHGRRFAGRWAVGLGRRKRILRALASPLVPFLMLQRIAEQVWTKRRYRGRFLSCLPLLLAFLTSWSAGEFVGYLFGPIGRKHAGEDEGRVLRTVE